MKYIVTINDNSYEVEVERGKATIVGTGEIANVVVQKVETDSLAEVVITKPQANMSSVTNTIGEGDPLKAPMPGTILDILVSQGDKVKEGDVLFILEAMKMENEIMATKGGVVTQILVTKGKLVATNDVIARIK